MKALTKTVFITSFLFSSLAVAAPALAISGQNECAIDYAQYNTCMPVKNISNQPLTIGFIDKGVMSISAGGVEVRTDLNNTLKSDEVIVKDSNGHVNTFKIENKVGLSCDVANDKISCIPWR